MNNKAIVNVRKKDSRESSVEVIHQPTVAIIDDDTNFVNAIARVLRSHHECTVEGYPSVEYFLGSVDSRKSDNVSLILLDFHLPGENGPKLVDELRKRNSPLLSNCYFMGMTGDREKIVQNEFHDAGIEEIIQKPLQNIDYSKISSLAHAVNKLKAYIAYQAGVENETVVYPNIIKKYI